MKDEVYYDRTHLFDRTVEDDDRFDDTRIISHDGRSKTKTMFYPDESNDPQKFKRLIDLNEGMYESDRAVRNRSANKRRTTAIFAEVLEITDVEKESATIVIDNISAHYAHHPRERFILGIISLVTEIFSNRFIRNEEAFESLMDDLDMNNRDLRNIRKVARERIKECDAVELFN